MSLREIQKLQRILRTGVLYVIKTRKSRQNISDKLFDNLTIIFIFTENYQIHDILTVQIAYVEK